MQWRNLGFNISLFQMAYKLTHQRVYRLANQRTYGLNPRTHRQSIERQGRLKHLSFGQDSGGIIATSVLDWKKD